jgi:hypothetical protein
VPIAGFINADAAASWPEAILQTIERLRGRSL